MLNDSFPFKSLKLINEIGGYKIYEMYMDAINSENPKKPLEKLNEECTRIFKRLKGRHLIDPDSIWGKKD